MASILKLEVDVPQVIALKFADGKVQASKIPGAPDQMMFSLVDGKIAFLPLAVAERIRESGITKGTPFKICKRRGGKFDLATHNEKAAGGGAPTASSMSSSKSIPVLNANTNHFEVPVRPIPQKPTPWPVHTPAQQAVIARKLGAPEQQPERRYVPDEAARPSPMAERFLSAFVVALDVVGKVQEAVEQRGLGLNFQREDTIQRIATSVFIESNKGVRS
jgi:hypothetical protein